MTRAPIVRLVKRCDAAALAQVHACAWRAAYRGLIPRAILHRLGARYRARRWRQWLHAPTDRKTFVIDVGGRPAGFCVVGPRDETDTEIFALNVRPDAWGRGLGTALVRAALREARRQRCRALTLWVLAGNTRARRFYQNMGFTHDGAQRNDTQLVGVPLRELRYRHRLDG